MCVYVVCVYVVCVSVSLCLCVVYFDPSHCFVFVFNTNEISHNMLNSIFVCQKAQFYR